MTEKVLITGITGFVGSHMADYALKKNVKVFGLKRWNLSRLRNVRHILKEIELVDCDLTEPIGTYEMIRKVRPTKIFHFAAQSFISQSWNHPLLYMDVNYRGTVNLLEAIRRIAIHPKILIASSVAMYGDVQKEDLPMTEKTPLNPLNPYAVSKIAQDYIGYVYHKTYGMHVVRTRAFNIEGPRSDKIFGLPWYAHQIAQIEAGKQRPIITSGYVGAKRNFIHVADIVDAYWRALQNCKPDAYLIGSETKKAIHTFGEAIDGLMRLSTYPGKIIHKIDKTYVRPTNETVVVGDCSKFERATHWFPRHSFQDLLRDVLDYWRMFEKEKLY